MYNSQKKNKILFHFVAVSQQLNRINPKYNLGKKINFWFFYMDECKSHFLASRTQTQRQIKANNDKELLIGSQWLTLLVQSAILLRA